MKRHNDLGEYFKGCLIGGAVGDALGYPVEHMTLDEIKQKYGLEGIDYYSLKKGLISDDTQMVMFTINGILVGETYSIYEHEFKSLTTFVLDAYLDWLVTQGLSEEENRHSWLLDVKKLYEVRSPGRTIVSSLIERKTNRNISLNKPLNNSKGCGAVTRIAPVGLIAQKYGDPFIEAARISAITHGHPMSTLATQLMATIINNIFKYEDKSLWTVIKDSIKEIKDKYEGVPPSMLDSFNNETQKYLPSFIELMKNALVKVKHALVQKEKGDFVKDTDMIASLGEGWVAEEALAIAIYCAVRHVLDPLEGIKAAANHSGDSDSTASLTGQILGAYCGLRIFPDSFIENLENHEVILELADDLVNGCQFGEKDEESIYKKSWETKYREYKRYNK